METNIHLYKLEISNLSHPFFTGKMNFVDTAGRIDKFNKRYAKKKFNSKRVDFKAIRFLMAFFMQQTFKMIKNSPILHL
jgi:hypothetical protein